MLRVTLLVILAKMAVSTDLELHDKYLKMPRQEFIEYFNSQNFSWKITDYNRTFYYGRYKTSTDLDEKFQECEEEEVLKDLPKYFDSRKKWPQCESIKEINDQGHCGSCWTFGSGNAASDRTCIHKDIHVHLSEQDFECATPFSACDGGNAELAFTFWQKKGLVTKKCKPYDIEKLKKEVCTVECVDKNMSYIKDKHFAEKVYRVCPDNMDAIRTEIFKNGPIHAGFVVYTDFEDYKEGIYEHKYGTIASGHSVRVIGYGVENGIEYWLVANSYGKHWGEKGYFRIKVNQDLVKFEQEMYAGIPKN